jgi:acetylornithine/N-succinyldiaminopimelate aminotransferase
MQPGTHGSTYGSNPLAMAVGNAVLDIILADGFIDNVENIGNYLQSELKNLQNKYPAIIEEIRGHGLMVGLKLKVPNTDFVEKLREQKLLTVPASDNVVRMLPPLIIAENHVDEAMEILGHICQEYE